MNLKLKGKITERFNTARNFSHVIKQDAAIISKVIHGRIDLPESEKKRWAGHLGVNSNEIFSGSVEA